MGEKEEKRRVIAGLEGERIGQSWLGSVSKMAIRKRNIKKKKKQSLFIKFVIV